MLKWLKKKLRSWLLEDEVPPLQVEILREGKIERVTATRSVGLYLMCQSKEGFELMVKESDAMNVSHFQKLWKYLSDDTLVWGDGTPYDPTT